MRWDHVFRQGRVKWSSNSFEINQIRRAHVFYGPHDKCAPNRDEVGSLDAEHLLRDVPGKGAQWRGHPERFRMSLP